MSNVDSQASAMNGIVIQVLGEMSNNGNPNRKFAQTFFLAEQPNGYYVLNDIFRYLKDDDDVDEEEAYNYAEEVAEEVAAEVAEEVIEEIAEQLAEELEDLNVKETTKIEIQPEGDGVTIEETITTEIVPEPESQDSPAPVNGGTEPTNGEEPSVEVEPEPKPEEIPPPAEPEISAAEPVATPPAVEEPAILVAPSREPERAPPVPTAAAPIPARPKTWANLVAASAPGPAPAAQGAPVIPATVQPQTQTPVVQPTPSTPATPTTPGGGAQWQTADNKRHSRPAGTATGQTLAYVKNVSESVSNDALKQALLKFGPLNHFEIHRQKVGQTHNCPETAS